MTSSGVYLDPDKVKAIQEIQSHQNFKEFKGLPEWLAYIQRFVKNLLRQC